MYQNLSTNSSSQDDVIMHALSKLHHVRASKKSRIIKKWLSEKSCCFDENNLFSIILLPEHVQYVCNESAKYQIASTNIRDELTSPCMHYCHAKATIQEEQWELTVKE